MRISDIVARYIIDMLEENNGDAEIRRNELAETLGCVPSQINYVITSRFTPEHGYIVESRRGGGGYIKITRVSMDKRSAVMHIINNIGDSIDNKTANNVISELVNRQLIGQAEAKLLSVAVSDRTYQSVPPVYRDSLRACILKNMILNLE
ncbi:MAG: CtsR family transcriptional regulator [Clostridia bacterium]|nr:CtsR family transcriptional regulator [Clostridia bacterium]